MKIEERVGSGFHTDGLGARSTRSSSGGLATATGVLRTLWTAEAFNRFVTGTGRLLLRSRHRAAPRLAVRCLPRTAPVHFHAPDGKRITVLPREYDPRPTRSSGEALQVLSPMHACSFASRRMPMSQSMWGPISASTPCSLLLQSRAA